MATKKTTTKKTTAGKTVVAKTTKSKHTPSEILKKVEEYLNHYPSYLSYSTPYAKGFKDGCYIVHDNLLDIIKEMKG